MNGEYAFIKVVSKTMRDNAKSKAELLKEVEALRRRVAVLEQAEDVTKRKKAEEEIKRTAEEWDRTFNAIADLVFIVDKDFTITKMNKALPEALKLKPEDIIGKKCYELLHKSDKPWPGCPFEKTKKDKEPRVQEVDDPNIGIPLLITTSPILDDKGKLVGAVHIAKDITENKKAEEELRAFEERFSSLAERSFDLIFMTDAQGCLTYVSDASEKIFHCKPQEMIGTHFKNYLIESEIPRVSQRFAENMQGRNLGILPMEAMRKDGSHVFVELNSSPILKDGETIGIQGIIRDITERKKAEEALLFKSTLLEAQSETSIDGILVVDSEGKSISFNKNFGRMWNIPQQILDTRDDEKMLQHVLGQLKTPEQFLEKVRYLYAHKNEKSRDEIQFKDGRVFDRYSSPLLDSNDKYYGRVWYFRDITEHRQAEQKVRESEEKYRGLTESLNELVYRADPETFAATYVNNAVERFYGCSVEEWLSDPSLWENSIHPDDKEIILREFEEAKRQLKNAIIEYRIINKHKEVRWVEDHVSWERDQEGKVISMNGVVYDISERRNAEQSLRESEERLRVALSAAQMGTWRWDPATNQDTRDASFNGILGLEAVESTQPVEDFLQRIHPEERDMVDAEIQRTLREHCTYVAEFRIVRPDGTVRWLRDQGKPLYDEDDHILYMTGAVVDITERKRAEDALRESEKKYKALFQGTAEGIIVADTETKEFKYANPAICKMLGYTEEELEQLCVRDIHPKEDLQHIISEFEKQVQREQTLTSNIPCLRKDGTIIYVDINTAMVLIDGRQCNVGFFTDITEHKKAEEEMNEYREKMAQAERLASLGTLSATLAHELNQPLTAIRLSIENSLADLETTSSPDTVIEDLKDGLSAVSDVASKVDRLRNFAQESSKEIISEVNLKAVAERILNLLNESARRAGVSLHLKGMDKLPLIQSNEKDLEQLFFALVENAIQAADGKKECRLIISGDVKDEHIELRFSDTCGGIAPENLDRIFEPFFTTRAVGERTGLGLCIVERIVSGAGGKIRLESKAGKGSTFFVTLPISRGRMS